MFPPPTRHGSSVRQWNPRAYMSLEQTLSVMCPSQPVLLHVPAPRARELRAERRADAFASDRSLVSGGRLAARFVSRNRQSAAKRLFIAAIADCDTPTHVSRQLSETNCDACEFTKDCAEGRQPEIHSAAAVCQMCMPHSGRCS